VQSIRQCLLHYHSFILAQIIEDLPDVGVRENCEGHVDSFLGNDGRRGNLDVQHSFAYSHWQETCTLCRRRDFFLQLGFMNAFVKSPDFF
jgi:hypothetical protein